MAYPTGLLSIVLDRIDSTVLRVKQQCQSLRAAAAAGNVSSSRILDLYVDLRNWRAEIVAAAATPGMAQYARDQKNNQGLDVVTEFNAMVSALDGVTTWMTANFPKESNRWLLAKEFSGDTIIDRQFTPAVTADLRTQLDTLIATIN